MPMAPKSHQPSGRTARQNYDQNRGTAAERGYDHWWYKERQRWVKQQISNYAKPFCVYCGIPSDAMVVDHAIPPLRLHRRGTMAYIRLFRDQRYWMLACRECNTLKGALLPNELEKQQPEMYRRMVKELAGRGVKL